jgi:hypothetical protein
LLLGKGRVTHADAVTKVESEYEEFAARRRELLEAEQEAADRTALEEAAKALPEKKDRPRKSERRND